MVLIGDIVGDDENAVAAPPRKWSAWPTTAWAKASSPSARKRARNSGSTARAPPPSPHTNAFKINEDVVIPLPRMGEYTDGIERINIELSIKNKLQLLDELDSFFAGQPAAGQERRRRG
jgi:FAD/FMN-containing dehydrogenase